MLYVGVRIKGETVTGQTLGMGTEQQASRAIATGGGAYIEGEVRIEHGDFVTRDKIDTQINVHKESALRILFGSLGALFRRHWPGVALYVGLGIPILALYVYLNTLPLIVPWWPFAVCSLLLAVAVGAWNIWRHGASLPVVKAIGIASAVVLAITLGVATWRIAWPAKPTSEGLAILVARFGEGQGYRRTADGIEVSGDLVELLQHAVESDPSLSSEVQVIPVGIIRDPEKANWIGNRMGADIVIWGRLMVSSEGGVWLRYSVLEAPESTSNPSHPRVLPVDYVLAEGKVVDLGEFHKMDFGRAVASQSKAVTYFVTGLVHYLERNHGKASDRFRKAVQILQENQVDPETGEMSTVETSPALLHYYLGRSYEWLGHTEQATAELEKAAALSPDDPGMQLGLAYNYVSVGRTEEARQVASRAVEIVDRIDRNRENKEVQYDKGLSLQLLGEMDLALSIFRQIIERDPDFYIAYVSAGRLNATMGRYDEAIRWHEQALEKVEAAKTTGVWTYLDLAYVYLKQGEIERARDAYLTAVRLEPDEDWAHYQLALFYESQSEVDAAWSTYETLVEVADNKAWAYTELGGFLYRQGLLNDAILAYKQAVWANPEDGMLSFDLAQLYVERVDLGQGGQDDVQLALAAFGNALDTFSEGNPNRYYVYAHRGRLHYEREEYDLASADLRSALAIQPDSPELMYSLALSYDAMGEVANACDAYRQALAAGPVLGESVVTYVQSRVARLCVP